MTRRGRAPNADVAGRLEVRGGNVREKSRSRQPLGWEVAGRIEGGRCMCMGGEGNKRGVAWVGYIYPLGLPISDVASGIDGCGLTWWYIRRP